MGESLDMMPRNSIHKQRNRYCFLAAKQILPMVPAFSAKEIGSSTQPYLREIVLESFRRVQTSQNRECLSSNHIVSVIKVNQNVEIERIMCSVLDG